MSTEQFSPWNQIQKRANCGPTSLSYCLFTLFGNEIDQDDVASSIYSGPRKLYKTYHDGFSEHELKRAALKFGAKAEFLQEFENNFEEFNRKLVAHIKTGNPAVFCIYDGRHWVAIVGYEKKGAGDIYYVNDPDDSDGDEVFDAWGKSGIKEEFADKHKVEYFAMLLSRKDGKPPALPFSRNLMNLVNEGSYDSMNEMIEDLRSMAKKASRDGKNNSYLADHLISQKNVILKIIDDLLDWESAESDFCEIKAFYDDYITLARASRIKMSKDADLVLLTAYMTSLLTTCAWMGEL